MDEGLLHTIYSQKGLVAEILKIHAICHDLGIEEIDLFTYIHSKMRDEPMFFMEEKAVFLPLAGLSGFTAVERAGNRYADSGILSRIFSESRKVLFARLLLYIDPDFRRQNISIYEMIILPRIRDYDFNMVLAALGPGSS